jgi:hypothetical protein
MFKTEASAVTTASADAVWAALIDVTDWPRWYPGYEAATADGPLRLGGRGTVTLVGGQRRPFEVFDWSPGSSFALGTQAPGAAIRFQYAVEPHGTGSRITLGHTLVGPTSFLFGWLFGRRIAGYLPVAAAALAAQVGQGELSR